MKLHNFHLKHLLYTYIPTFPFDYTAPHFPFKRNPTEYNLIKSMSYYLF